MMSQAVVDSRVAVKATDTNREVDVFMVRASHVKAFGFKQQLMAAVTTPSHPQRCSTLKHSRALSADHAWTTGPTLPIFFGSHARPVPCHRGRGTHVLETCTRRHPRRRQRRDRAR